YECFTPSAMPSLALANLQAFRCVRGCRSLRRGVACFFTGWAAVATSATWLMTLFINRTQHRDTQALYAKLDELLRTHGEARTDLTMLNDRDVEDIEEHRKRHRELDVQLNRRTRRLC